MSAPQNFRTSFNGFNREDVVHYIEYINARHNTEVNQLKAELDLLRNQQTDIPDVATLEEELASLRAERDALLAKVTKLEEQATAPAPAVAAPAFSAEQELETYRRAERMERIAKERADAVYHQVNATLAEASTQLSGAAGSYGQLVDSVVSQISQLQAAVESGKIALENAAAAMGAIRPEGSEE